jgi:hypothetical protein
MASTPSSERVPTPPSPPSEKLKVEEQPPRVVKTASKERVRAAIERLSRVHADLIRDLAKDD